MAKFSEVLCIVNGKNQRKVENPNGKYPIYGSGGIMGYANDHLCDANTVVIGRKGSINNPIYVETPFWNVDTAFGLCSDVSKLYPKYLYYFCVNFDFEQLNTTVTIPSLTKSNILNIEIPLPPLDEQRRIAAVLDKVSDLIAKRRAQLDKLDELVKARFVEMFGDPVSNPKGWPVHDFKDISTLITDGEHATPRRAEKGIYLLSARNILNHSLRLDDVDYIDNAEYDRIAHRLIPQEGDVLLSCSGSIGRCCVVPAGLKFQMVRSVALIRFTKAINPVYAEWLITSDELQRQILQFATQSSQANLFQGRIQKLNGYVPPRALQDEFAKFVDQFNKSKLTIHQSLDKLEILKKALMQEYFG